MDRLTIVNELETLQGAVFTSQQLAALWAMSSESTSVRVHRLVASNALVRITRGRYCLPSAPILAIASSIYPPSYVSLWSAFEFYGTTTQSPGVIDVITPSKSGTLDIIVDDGTFSIRFINIKPSSMYGYRKTFVSGKICFIAEKEKAIVDGLLFPHLVPIDETYYCIRSGIDPQRAIEYAKRTGKEVVIKRLGCLLSRAGEQISPLDLGSFSPTYIPLDPGLPHRGKYSSTWRVIINRMIE